MDFWVNGIVSQRDKQPYIQLSNENGMIAQLTMSQARQIAMDMLVMASRAEVDAMVHEFCAAISPELSNQMMFAFREYRAKLDADKAERSEGSGETV